jgi:hypothetical protein
VASPFPHGNGIVTGFEVAGDPVVSVVAVVVEEEVMTATDSQTS